MNMERQLSVKLSIMSILVVALSGVACGMLETPKYTVLISKSDVEIRLYQASSWLSAPLQGTNSFDKATKLGFHRMYQYMKGANLNSTKLNFTAPILTSITPRSGGNFDYSVMFYLPKEYEFSPPQPNPDLNLELNKWASHCVAVRKFAGYAKDDNITKEKTTLIDTFNHILQEAGNHSTISETNNLGYVIAQYTAPFKTKDRLNEVWLNVSGSLVKGCP